MAENKGLNQPCQPTPESTDCRLLSELNSHPPPHPCSPRTQSLGFHCVLSHKPSSLGSRPQSPLENRTDPNLCLILGSTWGLIWWCILTAALCALCTISQWDRGTPSGQVTFTLELSSVAWASQAARDRNSHRGKMEHLYKVINCKVAENHLETFKMLGSSPSLGL